MHPETVVSTFLKLLKCDCSSSAIEKYIDKYPELIVYSCWEIFRGSFPRGLISLLMHHKCLPQLFPIIKKILIAQNTTKEICDNCLRILFEGRRGELHPIIDAIRAENVEYLAALIEVAPSKNKILEFRLNDNFLARYAFNMDRSIHWCVERMRFIVAHAPHKTKLLKGQLLNTVSCYFEEFRHVLVEWICINPSLLQEESLSPYRERLIKLLEEREVTLVEDAYCALLEKEGDSVDYSFPTLVLSFIVQQTRLLYDGKFLEDEDDPCPEKSIGTILEEFVNLARQQIIFA